MIVLKIERVFNKAEYPLTEVVSHWTIMIVLKVERVFNKAEYPLTFSDQHVFSGIECKIQCQIRVTFDLTS